MSIAMQEILPNGGLASFQDQVSKLADLGRYEDAYFVHAAEGETVVPMAVFDENPRLKEMLFAQMRGMGIDPERYVVGNEFNSINPITGQPEFFLKKIFKEAKKAVKKIAPYAGLIAGAMGAGPGWSALAGGIGGMYGSENELDFGAGVAGALSGYGAGKAFGTAGWAGGAKDGIFGSGDYIFGAKDGAMSQLGSNLGFGTKGTAGSQTLGAENAAELGVDPSTTWFDIAKDDNLRSQTDWLVKMGQIKNPASAMTGWEKAMIFGLPLAATIPSMLGGDDDSGGKPEGWDDLYPDKSWGGEFGNPTLAANGGIIQKYNFGGDVNIDIIEIQSLMDNNGMTYEEAKEYLESLEGKKQGGIINAYDNGGPVRSAEDPRVQSLIDSRNELLDPEDPRVQSPIDRREELLDPEMDEGYQFNFDVDKKNRTYSFDEPGMTNAARQAFLAREGITPIVGGIAGAGVAQSEFDPADYKEGYLMLMQNLHPDTDRETHEQEYDNWFTFADPTTEEYQDRKNRLLKFLSNMPRGGAGYESAEEHWAEKTRDQGLSDKYNEMIQQGSLEGIGPQVKEQITDMIQRGELSGIKGIDDALPLLFDKKGMTKDQEYTEDKYADGGIAHLAGGSFPRMNGEIAGPGGPRDDMVPAMLSDGEFVMTAQAVKNAGGGSRREGAKRMYDMMNRLESGVA